jgi:GH18 family chitinase
VSLKAQNPNLKVLAAVGGYNYNLLSAWPTMAASPVSRNNFATNVLKFLQDNRLDGIGK